MDGRWTSAQVAAVAPDAASLAAARKLGTGAKLTSAGWASDEALLWGYCAGSGKSGYQICVDLAEPAYKCSCPSRKFPCKHTLALLLSWADEGVSAAEPVDFARQWKAQRAGRAQAKATRASAPATPQQQAAAEKRAAVRDERMRAGVDELARWLDDRATEGLAPLASAGYAPFDQMAARLVDAQVPGLAARVRECGAVASSGSGWADRLLVEMGLLRLLVTAAGQLDQLPGPFAATVRARLGRAPGTEEVLATEPTRDTWQVLGSRDTTDSTLVARAVWLRGRQTGQVAQLLAFAPPGQPLPAASATGTEVDADLYWYPGALELRAVLRPGQVAASSFATPAGAVSVESGIDQVARALGADPWLDQYPLLLRGALVPGRDGSPWCVMSEGEALPLVHAASQAEPWHLYAATGGQECDVAVEWTPRGVVPLSVWTLGGLVNA